MRSHLRGEFAHLTPVCVCGYATTNSRPYLCNPAVTLNGIVRRVADANVQRQLVLFQIQ